MDKLIQRKLGELLKLERERQEIELDKLAEQLKIVTPSLEAIERGDSSSLPSELYFTLFAKSYAQAVGVDYQATVDAIEADIERAKEEEKVKPARKQGDDGEFDPEAERSPLSLTKIGLGVVGLLALLLLLNRFVIDGEEWFRFSSSDIGAADQIDPKRKAMEEAFASYNWQEVTSEQLKPLTLRLTARQDCWATVFADGDTALRQTLRAGNQYDIEASYRFQLWIGAPQRVSATLNGSPIDLAEITGGRVNGLEINQSNLEKFLPEPKSSDDLSGVNEG
jgi:cytoskeletal protein RodZ